MKELIFVSFCILISITAGAQNQAPAKKSGGGGGTQKKMNLAGNWQGVITQPGQGLSNSYAFWISFTQVKDSVKGLSRIELNDSDNFGILEFKGSADGNEVFVQETKITDENIVRGSWWCIKKYTLKYNESDGSLSGEWTSTKTCGPGKIYVFKTDIAFNKDRLRTSVYLSYEDFKLNVKETEKILNRKVILPGIVFENNDTQLSETSKKTLDEVVSILKSNSKLVIKFMGHTDDTGDDFPNFAISVKRARAVLDYVKSKGIKANRLQYEGFGEACPISDNTKEKGREKNRRIEFEIVKG